MSPAVSRRGVIGAANPTNQLGTENNEFLPEKTKSSVERVWTKAKVYRGSLSTFFRV